MGKKQPQEPSCLYPSEDELARLILGDRAPQWPTIAKVEERVGLPRVQHQYGGRYWPAVKAFYDRRFKSIEEHTAEEEDEEKLGGSFDEWRARRARTKATKAKGRSN